MVTPNAQELASRSAEIMWSKDHASKALGMVIDKVAPGSAQVSMRIRDDMVNGWDLCHGGLIASLADSAFALACNSHGIVTVAAGFDITFLESGRLGDTLVAEARQIALRGRSGVYDVTVRNTDTVIAEFRGRSRSLHRPIIQEQR
ncbi:hydroxyphenylacetyl-CoA thioesterase PaaI [Mycolicibacterium komossense]|uniref:Hydroxyphenylacetyl-CoA thioesterase PaaI n=1 Tax=Mycolicibacterium komossense TaxID=1779 RepID=A0ABT3C669_9MYCO|nr:hydroxyphenylacetyl-CoA thioesterase PaaI [Mycolicibacterium komossense]MCV7224965.1 hydroxyphenylacetyl-CoA thioesterase PaaI [Mycolicibacterium komossense]